MKVFGIFFLILFLSVSLVHAGEQEPEVYIITVLPGDPIHTAFGHSAIRIDNRIYNYGTFSFHEPGFLANFVKGKMQYYLGVSRYDRELVRYIHRENRSIYEQRLDLTAEETAELKKFLKNNAKKENRHYDYEFIKDNCSSRIRDVLNNVLGDGIEFDSGITEQICDKSYRDYIRSYLGNHPWFDTGIQFTLGMVADRKVSPEDAFFLPELVQAQFEGCSRIADSGFTYEAVIPPGLVKENVPDYPFILFSLLAAVEILLIVFSFFRKGFGRVLRIYEGTAVFVNFLAGLLIFYLMFFSAHFAVKGNMHILWLSPISLILLVLMISGNFRMAKVVAVLQIVSAVTSAAIFSIGLQETCRAFYPAVILYLIIYVRTLFAGAEIKIVSKASDS